MKRYVAAALTIGIAIGPASAFDTGIGGNVGGVGVGAGVSAGSQGVSVGVGTSVDGVGGASVGASVGASNGSVDASVSASGNVGDTSGGISTGVGVGDDPAAEHELVTAPGSPAAVTTATAKTARQSIVLPPVLMPSNLGDGASDRVSKGYPLGFLARLKAKTSTPAAVVRACRGGDRVRCDAAWRRPCPRGKRRSLRQRRGALTAPIEVRIDYARQGGIEVRQAQVSAASMRRAGSLQ